jgi:hypothetical protein
MGLQVVRAYVVEICGAQAGVVCGGTRKAGVGEADVKGPVLALGAGVVLGGIVGSAVVRVGVTGAGVTGAGVIGPYLERSLWAGEVRKWCGLEMALLERAALFEQVMYDPV